MSRASQISDVVKQITSESFVELSHFEYVRKEFLMMKILLRRFYRHLGSINYFNLNIDNVINYVFWIWTPNDFLTMLEKM